MKRCGKFIITRKSVYFYTSKAAERQKVSDQLAGGFLFELMWLDHVEIKVIACIIIVAWNGQSPAGNQGKIFSRIGDQEGAILDSALWRGWIIE